MATDYDNTKATNDAGRRALLEAVSRAGSAGKKAYEMANTSVNDAHQAAVQAALTNRMAGGVDVGTGPQDHVAQMYKSQLGAQESRFQDDLARKQVSTEDYLTKLGAALPVMQQRLREDESSQTANLQRDLALQNQELDANIALGKEKWQQQQEKDLADRQWEKEKQDHERASWAREDSTSGSGSGGSDLSDSELRNLLGGAADNFVRDGRSIFGPGMDAILRDTGNIAAGGNTKGINRSATARLLGERSMLDRDRVAGLFPDKAQKADVNDIAKRAKIQAADVPIIQKDPDYLKLRNRIQTDLQGGLTYEEWEEGLRAELFKGRKNKERSFRYLLAEFGDLFPSITEQTRLDNYGDGA